MLLTTHHGLQKWFPACSVAEHTTDIISHQDKKLMLKLSKKMEYMAHVRQQEEFESTHRDLMIGFRTWEFDPMDLKNPFPNNEGSVHLWHGDEYAIMPVSLQHYIAQQLPWIIFVNIHLLEWLNG